MREPLDNTTEVETPEQVRFRYRLAGPVRRGLAYLLDTVIRFGVLVLVAMVVTIASGGNEALEGAGTGLIMTVLFVLEWGYFVACETIGNGTSLGKKALGLRVVKEGGYPIGFLDSVLRNLLRAADFLPAGYVLGLAMMSADHRYRRLGDRVAGTMVVVEERMRVAPPLVLSPPITADELAALPARIPLSVDEREAIELLLRRADLGIARRHELAQMLAPKIAERIGLRIHDPVRFLAILHQRVTAARAAAQVTTKPAFSSAGAAS